MFEKLIDRLTEFLPAVPGLIRIPSGLEADFAAAIFGVPPIELHRWLELPREEQGPSAAVALYKSSAAALTVAIFDPSTQKLHSVIQGTSEELPRVAGVFFDRFGMEDRLAGADLKPPSEPPKPPPDLVGEPGAVEPAPTERAA